MDRRHQHPPDLSCQALSDPRLDARQKNEILFNLIERFPRWFSMDTDEIYCVLSDTSIDRNEKIGLIGVAHRMLSTALQSHPLFSMKTTRTQYEQWRSGYWHKRQAHDTDTSDSTR